MKRNVWCGVGAVLALAWTVSAQEAKTAYDPEMPPVVVRTVPAANGKGVDPALAEIRVTFDRPMRTERSWSWVIHEQLGAWPGIQNGPEPRWEDEGRTCVLAAKLAPGTLYALGANSFRHTGFRDRDGHPAVPFVWVFRTREQ